MSEADRAIGTGGAFLDTNVLIYLLSDNALKADIAQDLLRSGGVVSVQVLNEFASVALRKTDLRLDEVREVLGGIRRFCRVEPLTIDTHELGLAYSARYRYSIYDSMILAAATLAGCTTLVSEDLHADQAIGNGIRIRNPFVAAH